MSNAVYNYLQWEKDGEFNPFVGQEIDIEIVLDMRDCVPPAYQSNGIIQCGEPYDHDYKTFQPLYTTFQRTDGKWHYCGHCYLGKTEDKTERGYGHMARMLANYR